MNRDRFLVPARIADEVFEDGMAVEISANRFDPEHSKPIGPCRCVVARPHLWDGTAVNVASLDADVLDASTVSMHEDLYLAERVGSEYLVAPPAPQQIRGRTVGDYPVLISSLKRLAETAESHGVKLLFPNAPRCWAHLDHSTRTEDVSLSKLDLYFGTFPKDWVQVAADVGEDRLGLCLDLAHAITVAHNATHGPDRQALLYAFMLYPDKAPLVRWSDGLLREAHGRDLLRLALGDGDLPEDIHVRILRMPGYKTLALGTADDVAASLAYLERLEKTLLRDGGPS